MNQSQKSVSYKILVSGKVQGVGYRRFVERAAIKYQLNGWTRNLFNGKVQILVEGDAEMMKQFILALWTGNGISGVSGVRAVELTEAIETKGFQIRPDGEET